MKILAIGAHFDDIELGCGGTLLRHKKEDDDISLLVVTHSGYQSVTKNIVRKKEDAKSEGQKSAKYLGARLISMDKDPLVLVPSEKFVLEMDEIVNKIKPDRVYTHRPNDNHADHAAVGYVSVRACRKCPEVLWYRSNWYIGDEIQDDNYYVDISDVMDDKMKLLKFFESEMKNVNHSWIDFTAKQNSASGAKISVEYAETFRVQKMAWL